MNLNTARNRYLVPPTAGEAQSFERGLFGAEATEPIKPTESIEPPPPTTRPVPATPPPRPRKPAVRPKSVYLSR